MEVAKPENIFQICVVLTLLGAAISDLRTFRIPNSFPVFIIVLFVPHSILSEFEGNLASHIASFGLAFFVGLLAFRYRVMAGGDVKLIAVTALWFSAGDLYILLTLIALAGGIQAAVIVVQYYVFLYFHDVQAVLSGREPSVSAERKPGLTGRRVPYGVAIASGSIAAFLLTPP